MREKRERGGGGGNIKKRKNRGDWIEGNEAYIYTYTKRIHKTLFCHESPFIILSKTVVNI